MLQLKRDLFEIQEHAYELWQISENIVNPVKPFSKYLYHYTDGTQYIDTGIKVDDTTILELQFKPLNTNNSFICGTEELALMILNSTYVFMVGNKLYTTGRSVVANTTSTIQISKNGLVIDGTAYKTSGTIYFVSDNTILIGANYDKAITRVFNTLNSIDDVIDVSDNQVSVENEQLMNTLNNIDGDTSTYDGDELIDSGISAIGDKCIYYYKIYKNNNVGIRECLCSVIPIVTDEQEILFYDLVHNTFIGTEGTFLKGAQDIVDGITYSVNNIPNTDYTFKLNKDGYFESNNKGIASSFAIARLEFNIPEDDSLFEIDCINYAQTYYDYGVLSNIDTPLDLSIDDISGTYYKMFSNSNDSKAAIQPVLYRSLTRGDHFIDIKYRKNASTNSYNDSLQFKVVPPIENTYTVTKPHSGSYTFTLGSDGYYTSTNKNVSSSYALAKISLFVSSATAIRIDYVISSESGYDYGLISNLDSTLSSSTSIDSGVKVSTSGSSTSYTTYTGFTSGEHFIYVKYRKDSSVNSGTDTFKFKVSFS